MPIKAYFEFSLAFTYALPPAALEPFVSPGLQLDTHNGFGYLAVVMVQTRDLRPAFVPSGIGLRFFLCGYRIFTRYQTRSGQTLRGLRVLRTDTNRRAMRFFGNLFTHYKYELSRWGVRKSDGTYEIRVKTENGAADLHVEADVRTDRVVLPAGSPFEDFRAALRFAAPLPFTFDYERETHSIIRVQGVRQDWNPRPVPVTVHHCTFLDSDAFRGTKPVLANAFYIERVRYLWTRGIREEAQSAECRVDE